MGERIYLEEVPKRVFACALDWPGWCRSGRTAEAAMETLAATAPRYAVIAERAGVTFEPATAAAFEVVERVNGSGSTEFGVPDAVPQTDREPVEVDEAKRLAALLKAAWDVMDGVVAGAPATMRKGPRGGGRDRDAILDHVVQSERGYARQIGVRYPPKEFEAPGGLASLRRDVIEVLSAPSDGGPLAGEKGWPQRYAARRFAWHVIDHIWEIEDKSE